MKAMGTSKDHWDDELGNVLTDYLLLIDDYMTGATGRPLPDSAGIDTLVRIMTERFDALDSYGPLNWNTDPALWQDANHVRTELEQFRLRIGPDDLERPGIYEDFYKFMRRCAGAYQSQVWGETKAWGLRSPMNDYIRVGQTYQGFEISMQGRFINSRNQEVAWYKTSGGQVVFLNYLITPDTDTTVVSWRQELGRLEPGDIVFSVLDDTPRPVIIENITDDVATINYGESVQYPLPLLEKLPDETPVGSDPPPRTNLSSICRPAIPSLSRVTKTVPSRVSKGRSSVSSGGSSRTNTPYTFRTRRRSMCIGFRGHCSNGLQPPHPHPNPGSVRNLAWQITAHRRWGRACFCFSAWCGPSTRGGGTGFWLFGGLEDGESEQRPDDHRDGHACTGQRLCDSRRELVADSRKDGTHRPARRLCRPHR